MAGVRRCHCRCGSTKVAAAAAATAAAAEPPGWKNAGQELTLLRPRRHFVFWSLHSNQKPRTLPATLPAGHLNHSMFWEMLCPPKVRLASPQLATASCCFSLVLSRQRASQSAQAGMQVLGATRARLHPACPRSALALSPPCIACLCPAPQLQDYEPPSGALLQAIEADFGSLDKLVSKFNTAAVGVQVCVCV
jgi:hypothetical protein